MKDPDVEALNVAVSLPEEEQAEAFEKLGLKPSEGENMDSKVKEAENMKLKEEIQKLKEKVRELENGLREKEAILSNHWETWPKKK